VLPNPMSAKNPGLLYLSLFDNLDGFQVRAIRQGVGEGWWGVYFSNYMVEGRLSPQGTTEAKLRFYNVSYV
jgi:hypothetical protein